MLFRYRISSKSDEVLQKYDATSIFEDGGRGRSMLLPVSQLLMQLHSEGQNLSANQISSPYLNLWLRYSYFRFGKTNVRHIGILLPVQYWPFSHNWRVILHPAAEFRQNRNTHCGNMTSYRFLRWRPSAMLYLLWSNGGPPTKCLSWSEP